MILLTKTKNNKVLAAASAAAASAAAAAADFSDGSLGPDFSAAGPDFANIQVFAVGVFFLNFDSVFSSNNPYFTDSTTTGSSGRLAPSFF